MIEERIRIEYPPIRPSEMAATGSTRCRSRSNSAARPSWSPPGVVMPEVGNQPSPAANTMIRGMPITKYGME